MERDPVFFVLDDIRSLSLQCIPNFLGTAMHENLSLRELNSGIAPRFACAILTITSFMSLLDDLPLSGARFRFSSGRLNRADTRCIFLSTRTATAGALRPCCNVSIRDRLDLLSFICSVCYLVVYNLFPLEDCVLQISPDKSNRLRTNCRSYMPIGYSSVCTQVRAYGFTARLIDHGFIDHTIRESR